MNVAKLVAGTSFFNWLYGFISHGNQVAKRPQPLDRQALTEAMRHSLYSLRHNCYTLRHMLYSMRHNCYTSRSSEAPTEHTSETRYCRGIQSASETRGSRGVQATWQRRGRWIHIRRFKRVNLCDIGEQSSPGDQPAAAAGRALEAPFLADLGKESDSERPLKILQNFFISFL